MPKVHFYVDLDRVRFGGGSLAVFLPASIVEMVERRLSVSDKKRYKFIFDVQRKKKPRTTGWNSQSHHLHGHLSQIADYLGYYMSELKEFMKDDLPDWPRRTIEINGTKKIVYMSEAEADTVLEAKAIEWCHVRAAELCIPLIEGDHENT